MRTPPKHARAPAAKVSDPAGHRSRTRRTCPLEGSRRPPRPGDVRLGPADPEQMLTVSLRLRRRADRPAPPLPWTQPRGQHLSRAAYAAEYGAAEADLERVARFAAMHGLAVVERHAGRRTVRLAGTVRQMERTFGVTLALYCRGEIRHRGFEGRVHLPSALADVVEHIAGLDDRPVGRPHLWVGQTSPAGRVDPLDETTGLMTPAQVAALYDFPAISAAGQTIGIIEFGGGFRPDDVATYFSSVAGLPTPDSTFVSIDGAANLAPAPLAGAGSPLHGYFGGDTSQHVNFVANDGHVHELYAEPGGMWLDNDLTTDTGSVPPAPGTVLTGYWGLDDSQHVNFIGVDGHVHELYLDPGSPWVCNDISFNGPQVETALDIAVAGSVAQGARLVVYMAPNTEQGWVDALSTAIHDSTNNPSVLSISWGGDEGDLGDVINGLSPILAEAGSLGVTLFASSGDAGSENPPQVQYPASDPSVTGCGGTTIANVNGPFFDQIGWGGSGGGFSTVFDRPDWQANALGASGRGVPDIGGDADPNSGYELMVGQAPLFFVGGTSAVAPLYAGLVALFNASLGGPVGWLNGTLYGLADPSVFDDVATGNNGAWNAQPG